MHIVFRIWTRTVQHMKAYASKIIETPMVYRVPRVFLGDLAGVTALKLFSPAQGSVAQAGYAQAQTQALTFEVSALLPVSLGPTGDCSCRY